jgi:hypothetical protein
MTDSKLHCGDEVLLTLVRSHMEGSSPPPVEMARSVFAYMAALEAEASILSLRNELATVRDVNKEVAEMIFRRQFKQASAVAVAYGSQMGKTPHQCVRPFALRAAQIANAVSPAEMNAANGTAFCDLMAELEGVLAKQVDVEVARQDEKAAP